MLKIHPIPAFTDNYIWAIINDENNQAIIIDAGQATPVLDFLQKQHLELTDIWVTHHHDDHIGGVAELAEKFPNAQVFAHANVMPQIGLTNPKQGVVVGESSELTAWGNAVSVWQVAGHTAEHIAYLLTVADQLHIFCGDTLFSAGCGRVFTGTIEQLFVSFDRLNDLHEPTALFYPAYEYTLSNLKFAEFIEPNNAVIQAEIAHAQATRQAGKPTLPTTITLERKINPFLKVINEPNNVDLINGVKAKTDLPNDEPFAVFKALRELKNNF